MSLRSCVAFGRGLVPESTTAGLLRNSRRCIASDAVGRVYHGPLSRTFRNLKLFSLTSFGLASSITPFFFIIESTLPLSARIALAGVSIGTSGVSTALVSWCGAPYVSTLRRLGKEADGIEMETTTLFLKARHTRVYDPLFLRDTGRPFAKWELAEAMEGGKEQKDVAETVAETRDGKGRVLGRWIVEWKGGRGKCRGVGEVIRCVLVDVKGRIRTDFRRIQIL